MISFLRYKIVYLLISLAVIGTGLYFAGLHGYRFSIEFVGGTLLDYQISSPISKADLMLLAQENDIKLNDVLTVDKKVSLRATPITDQQEKSFREAIVKKTGKPVKVSRYETVGPVVGRETLKKTAWAIMLAMVGILCYMTYAFKRWTHGLAAICAMLHDIVVVLGLYAVFGYIWGAEVDLLFVTALLTTLSFSVHDTIVVFDKIREYQRTTKGTLEELADRALTQTMVRSINNSLTIILMLIPLSLFGGELIRFFLHDASCWDHIRNIFVTICGNSFVCPF
ncbi:MAG: Protein-export membrane protein SecF [Microgenomates bacterium OLB22]|nr:MAG: Protein-export membrane protein SecF [Microgenomates bacterium OLB22]